MTGFEFHQKEVLAFDDGPFFHRSQAARKSLYVTAWRQPPLWVPPLSEDKKCKGYGLSPQLSDADSLLRWDWYIDLLSGGQWPPSGRSLANPSASLTAGPEGSCCQESKVAVTLTAGMQHACVSPGPLVVLRCNTCVFIPGQGSGR